MDSRYSLRPATMADLESYLALYTAETLEIYGESSITLEDVQGEWTKPGFDVETGTMAAFLPTGEMIALITIHDYHAVPVRPVVLGYVHPDYRGQGIGTRITEWAIERCRQVFDRVPPDARVVMQDYGVVRSADPLLLEMGFETKRQSLQMEIHLNGTIPRPVFPQGFTIQSMADGISLEQLVITSVQSFRDHRGYIDRPLEDSIAHWQHDIDALKDVFDPALFLLLLDGDTPAGELMAWPVSEESREKAWVSSLGILPEYRRRGLASQMLYQIFHTLQERGIFRVALGVDGSSLTGATKLYEKVGMHIAQRFNAYELELRPGIEMTNQG